MNHNDAAFYDAVLIGAISTELRALGMTQAELAQRADLSASFITSVMSGKSNLSLNSLVAIANALNVPLIRLFEPSESPASHLGADFPSRERRPAEALPKGYTRVECVLPTDRANMVQQWAQITQDLLKRNGIATKKKR